MSRDQEGLAIDGSSAPRRHTKPASCRAERRGLKTPPGVRGAFMWPRWGLMLAIIGSDASSSSVCEAGASRAVRSQALHGNEEIERLQLE